MFQKTTAFRIFFWASLILIGFFIFFPLLWLINTGAQADERDVQQLFLRRAADAGQHHPHRDGPEDHGLPEKQPDRVLRVEPDGDDRLRVRGLQLRKVPLSRPGSSSWACS